MQGASPIRNSRKPRAFLVFATCFVAFAIIIAAVVLLANDRKNLNVLLHKIGLDDLAAVHSGTVGKSTRLLPTKHAPPAWRAGFLKPLTTSEPEGFDRAGSFETAPLCEIINSALSEKLLLWKQNPVFNSESECSVMLPQEPAEDGEIHNSLFIQVRGHSDRIVSQVRMKLVIAPEDKEEDYSAQFDKAASAIFTKMHWMDLSDLLDDIKELKPFDAERHGLKIQLSKELLLDNAYNFSISLVSGGMRSAIGSGNFSSLFQLAHDPAEMTGFLAPGTRWKLPHAHRIKVP